MSEALERLARRLHVDPGSLDALGGHADDDLARLDAAIEAAMLREDAAVEAGFRESLGFLPRPLRALASSMLFPGGRG